MSIYPSDHEVDPEMIDVMGDKYEANPEAVNVKDQGCDRDYY